MTDRKTLEAAIAALQTQRALLGDAVVDAALGPMRERLARLATGGGAAPEQTLRQVSVLFLDVVGSTALSRHLDPEDVHAVMDGTLQRCTAVVQAHGGRVLQYAGDNLLAAFGAGQAQEDDAERAVRCGLALLGEGAALHERVQREHGHGGCHVRVGIHTGPVLLGGGVDEEGTIRGFTVNIAARMEQAAPTGALRISHSTWLLVRGLFDVQPQPPLQVKGHDGPLLTYLVQRALPRPFRSRARGIEGLLSPMVGRDREFAQLVALLDEVTSQRAARAATLVGEPGIGKTRLLHELQRMLFARVPKLWLLRGRAHPGSRLQPYGLLRDLLAWRMQIADSDSLEQAKAKLVTGLAPWLGEGAQAKAHRIGQLIGLDFGDSAHVRGLEPGLLRELAFAALHDLLRGLASGDAVVVLLFEDLHWADDDSLDFVNGLPAAGAASPMLVVASARPELLQRCATWGEGQAAHRLLHLRALDAAQGVELAQALLSRVSDGAHALRALLVERADGNPFYMEELVRMFIDDGVIAVEGEQWRVLPERLRLARVPATLVGVLQARLDALPASDRLALQQASIVGHVFWHQALAAIDARAPAALPALRERALVHAREGSAFEDTAEDAFHHHLLQQVTYDTVLKPARRAGHAAVAQWLAERVGDRPAEYLAVTAQHYERAGDDALAVQYFRRAAEDAQRRFANQAAAEYTDRALQSPAATDLRLRDALLLIRQGLADLRGERDLQEATLQQRAEIAETLDDDALRADVLAARAVLASRRGHEAQALELAERALALAEHARNADVEAMALGQIAWSRHVNCGELGAALEHARRAVLSVAEALQERVTRPRQQLHVQLLVLRGIIEQAAGTLQQARATAHHALALARELGLRRPQASILESLGSIDFAVGQAAQALGRYQACTELADEVGAATSGTAGRYNMALCHLELGQDALALQRLDEAEPRAVRTGDHDLIGRCLLLRGRLSSGAGRFDAAHDNLDQAIATFESIGAAALVCEARAVQATVHLAQGHLAQARQAAEDIAAALASGLSLNNAEEPLRALLACHRVWLAAGDARADDAITTAHAQLQARAARAGDAATRVGMLRDVALNREIVAACETAQAKRVR